MTALDVMGAILVTAGCLFYFAGTVGLIRLPDVHARLHGLTKADNIGLGFLALGLAIQSGSVFTALKLVLTWVFLMYTSSLASYLIAQMVYRKGGEGRRE